ncbi:hypothetical protein B0H66DRAFT_536267 [Apodospora peruviana]|uniref:Uncharacterized protein n=1 Tax=Apodospora peruviana TaxID=516989 RepID=A0AAE0HYT6_9PEZI|nr:hypothetical protein B0H66DRAFT_536267 [Apodospora peruviana]
MQLKASIIVSAFAASLAAASGEGIDDKESGSPGGYWSSEWVVPSVATSTWSTWTNTMSTFVATSTSTTMSTYVAPITANTTYTSISTSMAAPYPSVDTSVYYNHTTITKHSSAYSYTLTTDKTTTHTTAKETTPSKTTTGATSSPTNSSGASRSEFGIVVLGLAIAAGIAL